MLLKREDLTHTGSHKLNNVLGQGLLAQPMGKRRLIAETGAGQHGVATATAAALLGLECVVYMGEVDIVRQELNVFRMQLLGAEVRAGQLREPDAEGRDQRGAAGLGGVGRDHALLHRLGGRARIPSPTSCDSSSASSATRRGAQCRALLGGADPDIVVACVGGGSNAAGTFAGFADTGARLVGVEAAGGAAMGDGGRPASCTACARSSSRTRTARSSRRTRSPPASTTPASVPSTRTSASSVGSSTCVADDDEVLAAFQLLAETEGIIPALEPAHALAWVVKEAGAGDRRRARRC